MNRLLAFKVLDIHTGLAIMRVLGLSCDIITITRGKICYNYIVRILRRSHGPP